MKVLTGFTAKSFQQETISADGKPLVSTYHDRSKYAAARNKGEELSSGCPQGEVTICGEAITRSMRPKRTP